MVNNHFMNDSNVLVSLRSFILLYKNYKNDIWILSDVNIDPQTAHIDLPHKPIESCVLLRFFASQTDIDIMIQKTKQHMFANTFHSTHNIVLHCLIL